MKKKSIEERNNNVRIALLKKYASIEAVIEQATKLFIKREGRNPNTEELDIIRKRAEKQLPKRQQKLAAAEAALNRNLHLPEEITEALVDKKKQQEIGVPATSTKQPNRVGLLETGSKPSITSRPPTIAEDSPLRSKIFPEPEHRPRTPWDPVEEKPFIQRMREEQDNISNQVKDLEEKIDIKEKEINQIQAQLDSKREEMDNLLQEKEEKELMFLNLEEGISLWSGVKTKKSEET